MATLGRMLRTLDLRGRDRSAPHQLPRPDLGAEGPVADVRRILAEVKEHGDQAVRGFVAQFDHVELGDLRVEASTLAAALSSIPDELRRALEEARDSIRPRAISRS